MSVSTSLRALLGALVIAVLGMNFSAYADVKDYAFDLVTKEIKQGEAVIEVRLVNSKTGAAVPDAVIFATRLDMAPDGMEAMTTKVETLPSQEPGIYRFKTILTMAGGWQFSLGAKVQGETGTVEDKLILKALP